MRTFRLVIACPDRVGIVAKVSNFLASHNGWITEASHHSDNLSGWFFMRHEIRADSLPFGIEAFREALENSCGASPAARDGAVSADIQEAIVKIDEELFRVFNCPHNLMPTHRK